jgi:hypothetical protein
MSASFLPLLSLSYDITKFHKMSLHEQDAPQVAYLDELHQVARDREGLQPAVDKGEESIAPARSPDGAEEHLSKSTIQPTRSRMSLLWILILVVGCLIGIGVGIGAGFAIGKYTTS